MNEAQKSPAATGQSHKGDGLTVSGLYLLGYVTSNTARVFTRKDGSGRFVIVRHELALQPGTAVLEQFIDAATPAVQVRGDEVVTFPRMPEFKQVLLRVTQWKEVEKTLFIKQFEIIQVDGKAVA